MACGLALSQAQTPCLLSPLKHDNSFSLYDPAVGGGQGKGGGMLSMSGGSNQSFLQHTQGMIPHTALWESDSKTI